MNDARIWIVLVAAASFLAGAAAGVLFSQDKTPEPSTCWGVYDERFAETFELSKERRDLLRILLDQYASELANKHRAYEARLHAQLMPELTELADRFDSYIRDRVLPPSQRAKYDRLSEPIDFVAAQ